MALINALLNMTESVMPLTAMTKASGYVTSKPLGAFTQFLIKRFIKSFDINMDEVAEPDLSRYQTFNDFFIRKLKDGVRPVDYACTAVCPCDGTIGEAGQISAGRLIQAKGLDYSLRALIGGSSEDEAVFDGGQFACIYLSPSNYHRIHMPMDGSLVKTIEVPGRHFPVGHKNISHLENLYTKNERLVCFFQTAEGPVCLVMVGACLVGSIGTVWGGTLDRKEGRKVNLYESGAFSYKRGEEIGHFKYGSTVICLWPNRLGTLSLDLKSGNSVLYGRKMID